MADYQSSYTGAQVDASVAFGYDPDTEPHLNSQAGVTSDGIYQADRAVEAKIVNRNLLNNPYFRIDQRQGYVVPPNKNYYSDTALTTLVGQTSEYVTVTSKASGYNTINIGGTNYYVAVADCVRGYVNLPAKIGFDCWYNNVPSTITLLMQDGIKLDFTQNYGQIRQSIPKADLVGETLTVSVVFDSTLLTASGIVSTSYVQSEIVDSSYIRFIYNTLTDNVEVEVVTTKTGGVIVSAVKLEEGTISTLQAEIDSGAYDEYADLQKCMHYQFDFIGDNTAQCYICMAYAYSSTKLYAIVPLPVVMRSTSSLENDVTATTPIGAWGGDGNGNVQFLVITEAKIFEKMQPNGVKLEFTTSGATPGFGYLVTINPSAGRHFMINANL